MHENDEFQGYEIVGIEWIFRSDSFSVLTEYFRRNPKLRRLVKHSFPVGNDVDVDKMINLVHNLHQ